MRVKSFKRIISFNPKQPREFQVPVVPIVHLRQLMYREVKIQTTEFQVPRRNQGPHSGASTILAPMSTHSEGAVPRRSPANQQREAPGVTLPALILDS